MRSRVALLYGIGLTAVLPIVLLAFLNYGDGGSFGVETMPWRARNIHLAQEEVKAPAARSLSHGPSAEHQELKTLNQIQRSISPHQNTQAASTNEPHGLAADSVVSAEGVASTGKEVPSSKSSLGERTVPRYNDTKSKSSERWERLKPPSMLLRSKEEREKVMLNRREMWTKEQRRRDTLAELEAERARKLLMEEKNKGNGVQQPVGGKLEEPEKPGGIVDESMEKQRKALLIHAMAEERKKAMEMNEQWKKKREDFKSGKQVEESEYSMNGNSKLTVEKYFQRVCENPLGPLVECSKTPPRKLSELEASGDDIMLSVRTTMKYHDTRLPVLFETWFGEVEPSNVFIVTDGEDEDLLWKTNNLGMHYINIHSGQSHDQSDLCCKAGVELELLMAPQNSKYNWICHIDDDMYVNLKPLVSSLAHFDPRKDTVYYGRSGSVLEEPRIVKNVSTIGTFGRRYYFAVGGMYCLSRAMLELARPYLVGCKAFEETCRRAQEPEDVTVGLVIGTVLNQKLQWTEMIYSHGLDLLSSTPTPFLRDQVAFSYGYGASGGWNIIPNVVFVPGAIYNIDEDLTQFRSLHCHLHPDIQYCVDKKQQVMEESSQQVGTSCGCSWKRVICCQVYKDNYTKWMQKKMMDLRAQDTAELEKEHEGLRKTERRDRELREHQEGAKHG